LWKSKCWNPAEWLSDFFNQIVAQKRAGNRARQFLSGKKKGSPGDCTCYRPICLLSHSMKISERIVDSRVRDIVELTTNQCGFVSGCSTIDAIHSPSTRKASRKAKTGTTYLTSRSKSRVQTQRAHRRTPRLCVIPTSFCCHHGCHYKRPPEAGSMDAPSCQSR
uniref:Reverse transcriptase domain-containing protein n=1 Tax=Haemonchus placei TaxID=6290 RepID=A0A0N4WNF2_HAEPC